MRGSLLYISNNIWWRIWFSAESSFKKCSFMIPSLVIFYFKIKLYLFIYPSIVFEKGNDTYYIACNRPFPSACIGAVFNRRLLRHRPSVWWKLSKHASYLSIISFLKDYIYTERDSRIGFFFAGISQLLNEQMGLCEKSIEWNTTNQNKEEEVQ